MDLPAQQLLQHKGLLILAWIALLFAAERLAPAVPRRGGWVRVLRNAVLWVLNGALSPLIVVPVSLWAASHALGWRPDWLGGWQGLVFDVLVLDMLIYWWHRLNHEIPFLWRFHEVHHLDEFLDVTSAVRFHFGEVLLSAGARAIVIILLGIPFTSVILFEVLVLLSAIFHHSNLKLPPRLEAALSRVIVTPSIHWIHHHAIRRDTDSNYATIFSWWDLVFRSRSATRRTPEMKIGVENRRDEEALPLIALPFRERH
ncbi:sterol desaturase family protein [Nisaea acidiphila]|uniref:Sterol desaturase family protein n=1 Tax=Nisaea acidiphila TaxID=1862145 RepID=A0A9J7AKI5_9PROT|nr:sterol desaturase family protein [Nisaea acidiphila]UUX48000.1 sterol desaturase family protein [Nisaea acidiphila]